MPPVTEDDMGPRNEVVEYGAGVRSSRTREVHEQTMKQGESEGWICESYISRTHRNLCSCKIVKIYQLFDKLRILGLVDSPV